MIRAARLLFPVLFFWTNTLPAQEAAQPLLAWSDSLRGFRVEVEASCRLEPGERKNWEEILALPFSPTLPDSGQSGYLWLQFSFVSRDSVPLDAILAMGWYPTMTLRVIRNGRQELLEQLGTRSAPSRGKPLEERHRFRLRLPPGDSLLLLIELAPVESNYPPRGCFLLTPGENQIEASLAFFSRRKLVEQAIAIMAIFCFQALLFGFLWLITRRAAFGYYSFYLLLMCLVLYSRYGNYLFLPWPWWWGDKARYLNGMTSVGSIFLYFRFVSTFLYLRQRDPRLFRWIRWAEAWALSFLVVITAAEIWGMPPGNFPYFPLMTLPLLAGSVPMFLRVWNIPLPGARLIVAGSVSLALGAALANVFARLGWTWTSSLWLGDLFVTGSMIEVLFFSVALAFTLREEEKDKIEAQAALIIRLKENQELSEKLQDVRNRLARDLHDDIGATLSSIAFYAELAARDLQHPQSVSWLEAITQQARRMVDVMGDTVWSLHPRHDKAMSLFSRLQDQARLLRDQGIEVETATEPGAEQLALPMALRRQLYLIGKEAMNNILKHAKAGKVMLSLRTRGKGLELTIEDDGIGMEANAREQGNGLDSMAQRAREAGGTFHLESKPGAGTRICVWMPIPDVGEK